MGDSILSIVSPICFIINYCISNNKYIYCITKINNMGDKRKVKSKLAINN